MTCIIRLSALLMLLPLAACGGGSVRETLGIDRSAPDEFRVVSRPPLSVPPEFSLRPPTAGGGSAAESPAYRQAQEAVFGEDGSGQRSFPAAGSASTAVQPVTSSALESNAESRFLTNAGADKADPNVRDQLYTEQASAPAPEEEGVWDTLTSPFAPKDPVVDAKGEKKRLEQNQAEGKSVTEGDTPTKKQKDTGPLGRMLGY